MSDQHTHTHTHKHTHALSLARNEGKAHTRTRTRTHAHARTHTHTHTHTPSRLLAMRERHSHAHAHAHTHTHFCSLATSPLSHSHSLSPHTVPLHSFSHLLHACCQLPPPPPLPLSLRFLRPSVPPVRTHIPSRTVAHIRAITKSGRERERERRYSMEKQPPPHLRTPHHSHITRCTPTTPATPTTQKKNLVLGNAAGGGRQARHVGRRAHVNLWALARQILAELVLL